jgi:hypothetical protein
METALILAGIELVTELARAKIQSDQTAAADRQQLVDALNKSSQTAQQMHAQFLAESAKNK